jgi:4-amino-4-deoxychorismate lyase
MCQLLETIRIKDRKPQNIEYHNERLNKSRKELFNCTDFIDIRYLIQVPESFKDLYCICRVIYSKTIEWIEYLPYSIKPVQSLKMVHVKDMNYNYKYTDRSCFDDLLIQKENCDEILIIKDGFITDTSFSNIVLFDGKDWITPSFPLLKGTKREKLLKEHLIIEKEVTISDLKMFKELRLINAMIDIVNSPSIGIKNIIR